MHSHSVLTAPYVQVDHGWSDFSEWYDEKSWWPLGRPVGSTVYPGLMVSGGVVPLRWAFCRHTLQQLLAFIHSHTGGLQLTMLSKFGGTICKPALARVGDLRRDLSRHGGP